MSKWKKSLEENVSEAHEQQVLRNVSALLEQNARIAAEEKQAAKGRGWLLWAVPSLALGLVAVLMVPKLATDRGAPAPAANVASAENAMIEIALDYDMYRDLREIQDLELLQKLGDPDTWATKKGRPRKG